MNRPPLLAALSGVLLALAFPRSGSQGSAMLAWIALVPLFQAIAGETVSRAFRLGWLFGAVFFLATLYWVVNPITGYTSVAMPLAAGILLLLAAVLALYPALFAAGIRFWEVRTGLDGLVVAVCLWVGLEWCRSRLLLPFPWNLLGYAQYRNESLVQISELTGIYGPGALVVAVNFVVWSVIASRSRPEAFRRALGLRLLLVTTLVVGAAFFGVWRLREIRGAPAEKSLRIGFVQPGIDPRTKWDRANRVRVIEVQEQLSRGLPRSGAEVVVWPEASAPYIFASDSFYERDSAAFGADHALRSRMLRFVGELGVPLVFGSPAIAVEPAGRGEVWNSLNRVHLLSPSGRIEGTYDKMILVPFGEYVPMPHLLSFVDKLVPGTGMFVPGAEATVFGLGPHRFAVLICYEAIFPDFARRFVASGAHLLVNLTNDAWFGASAAPFQHLAMAAMRAVENRVPLIRVANTGISAVIGVDGKIRETGPLGRQVAGVAELRWSERATFYTRHGDLFAGGAGLAALLLLVYAGWMSPSPEVTPVGVTR